MVGCTRRPRDHSREAHLMTPADPVPVILPPRYYRSFAAYRIPFQPVDALDYAATEGLVTFYTAYSDLSGRILQFDKMLLVRAEEPAQVVQLAAPATPGTTLYFRAQPTATGGQVADE